MGTSNVEARQRFGVPVFGTLSHSFVMAYNNVEEAFRRFQQLFPEHAVLLIDTHDTLAARRKNHSSRPAAQKPQGQALCSVGRIAAQPFSGERPGSGLAGTGCRSSGPRHWRLPSTCTSASRHTENHHKRCSRCLRGPESGHKP